MYCYTILNRITGEVKSYVTPHFEAVNEAGELMQPHEMMSSFEYEPIASNIPSWQCVQEKFKADFEISGTTGWLQITKDSYRDAHECMPPERWYENPNTFILTEEENHNKKGRVVWIFGSTNDRYYVTLRNACDYEIARKEFSEIISKL